MIATLSRYMTRHPHTIRADEKLQTAHKLMSQWRIRHLPVLSGGDLVGIISERDVRLATSAGLIHAKVSDVCIDEPYSADIDTSLFVVASAMAERKIGSTVVLEEGKVVGIFTATDACRALAELLMPAGTMESAFAPRM